MSNIILYEVVITVGIILGAVTLVTKGEIGIVALTLLFIVMSCAEIYWWNKHQKLKYNNERVAQEAMSIATSLIGKQVVKELLDPMCLCGHPQSEHGSMGVCLHASNCICVDFKPFRKVES